MMLPPHIKHRQGVRFQLPRMAHGHYEKFGELILNPRREPPGRVVPMRQLRSYASRTGYWREGRYICAMDVKGRPACAIDPSVPYRGRVGFVDVGTGELMEERALAGEPIYWTVDGRPVRQTDLRPYRTGVGDSLSLPDLQAPLVGPDYYGNEIVSPATTDIFGWRDRDGDPMSRNRRKLRRWEFAPFVGVMRAMVGAMSNPRKNRKAPKTW